MVKDRMKSCHDCIHYGKQSCPLRKNNNGENTEFFGVCADYERYYTPEFDMRLTLTLLNEKYIFKCPTDTKELLVYEDGVYVPAECKVHEFLEEKYGEGVKAHDVEETIKHLQRANYVEREEINRFTNKIPVKNGFLNLNTRELEPFDSNQIFTFKLNTVYNPEAKCPNFLTFLKEILPEEDIPLLQEIMGYCILPAMPYHIIIWFYGTGRNGKGRIVLTLEFILGEENCSNLNLSDFKESRRFSLCQLYGKLVNFSSEPVLSKYGIQTNILKLGTGEDTIYAELKNKNNRLRFKNVAKLAVLGNRFPRVDDNSLGFWERVVILKYPFSFTGKKCIPNIERRWLPDEVSGIFNWMLDGLYRLKQNGEFSTSKTTEEIKTEFMRVSDPFRAWLLDCVIFLPFGQVTRDDAFINYVEYCEELGVIPEKARAFYNKLRETPKIRSYRTTRNGKTERGFKGITLKSAEERESEDESQTKIMSEPCQECQVCQVPISSENLDKAKKKDNNKPDISDISDTKSKIDIDEAFKQLQCFDCRRILTENTPYTQYEGKPICFTCFNKIEAQKKKPKCKNLTFKEDQPFCEWLQSFLADPKQCSSEECDGYTEEASSK
jgi:P4 family phage/plasmid primase-like protien